MVWHRPSHCKATLEEWDLYDRGHLIGKRTLPLRQAAITLEWLRPHRPATDYTRTTIRIGTNGLHGAVRA